MSTVVRPLLDFVIIIPDDEKDRKTKAGLFLPDTAFDKLHRGTVVATGPGKYEGGVLIDTGVYPGDRVIFGASDPIVLPDGRKAVLVTASRNLVAVEEKEDML